LGKQDAEIRMKRLARQHIAMHKVTSYEESFRIIDSVTRDDIVRLSESLLSPRESALLVYGCRGLATAEEKIACFEAAATAGTGD
jgi:hypothetical protein